MMRFATLAFVLLSLSHQESRAEQDALYLRVSSEDRSKSVALILSEQAAGKFTSLEERINEQCEKQYQEWGQHLMPKGIKAIGPRERSFGYVFRKTSAGGERVVCFIDRTGKPLSFLMFRIEENDLAVSFQSWYISVLRENLTTNHAQSEKSRNDATSDGDKRSE